jgi:L-fuconolactonase
MGGRRVLVVDGQVHIWQYGTPPPNHRQVPFTTDELLTEMDGAGVHRAILVPPLWDPAANVYSIGAAREHPDRFAVMGLVDLHSPRNAIGFRQWIDANGLRGIRISFNSPRLRALLASGAADWLWKSAEDAGTPIMLLAPQLCAWMGTIARQHPELRMVVDHMAIPRGLKAPAAFDHFPELLALARYPNVAVKMGGVPNYADGEVYPYRSLRPYLRQVIEAFGPARCFWASDLSRLHGSYTQCVDLFRDSADWLSEAERTSIMGVGLCDWLGWAAKIASE